MKGNKGNKNTDQPPFRSSVPDQKNDSRVSPSHGHPSVARRMYRGQNISIHSMVDVAPQTQPALEHAGCAHPLPMANQAKGWSQVWSFSPCFLLAQQNGGSKRWFPSSSPCISPLF